MGFKDGLTAARASRPVPKQRVLDTKAKVPGKPAAKAADDDLARQLITEMKERIGVLEDGFETLVSAVRKKFGKQLDTEVDEIRKGM